MVEFEVLGTLDLRDSADGRTIRSVLAQPKRVALMAYLALARPRGLHRRDALVRVFWPESSERRARHALSQALYVLRRGLGSETLIGGGADRVGVNPEQLSCDAVMFDEAVEGGDLAAALEIYGGDFLPGLNIDGSAEFERWLDTERERLREMAVETARSVAASRGRRGNAVGAVSALRRASRWAPFHETVHRELVQWLDRAGDRAGALRAFDAFAGRMEEQLETAPDPETRALVERIREPEPALELHEESDGSPSPSGGAQPPGRAGSSRAEPREGSQSAGMRPRPVAREGVEGEGVEGEGESAPANIHPTARVREWAAAGVLAAGLLLLVALAGVFGPGAETREPGASPGDRAARARVAVLPFQVRGSGDLSYLRAGMVELLSTKLDDVGSFRSVDPRAVLALEPVPVSPGDELARGREIADRLGADLLVHGSMVEAGGRLQLRAGLYDPEGALLARATSGPREESGLFEMVDELARRLMADRQRRAAEPGPPERLEGAR